MSSSHPPPPMPPLSSVWKAPEVEDPVNVYLHRPLAYLLVRAIRHTPVTPNQITLLSMGVGILAGAAFLWGTANAMWVGGILLWSSAILDGADGILARAQGSGSDIGRALDGTADAVVGVLTVLPAFAHLWMQQQNPVHLFAVVPALLSGVVHIYLYDFYKEHYLRALRPGQFAGGIQALQAQLARLQAHGGPWFARFAVKATLDVHRAQWAIVERTNPRILQEQLWIGVERRPHAPATYRHHNHWPMRGWALISLCPHSYLLAICAMLDRIDIYLWLRLIPMNLLFLVLLVAQRRATLRTGEALQKGRASSQAATDSGIQPLP